MKTPDIIAIWALSTSVLLNLFTLINAYKINRHTSYIGSVTQERIQSLEELKINSAKIISSIKQYILLNEMDREEFYSIGYLTQKIIYQLNKNSSNEREVIDLLEICNILVSVLYIWEIDNSDKIKTTKDVFINNKKILYNDFIVQYNSVLNWDNYINDEFISSRCKDLLILKIFKLDLSLQNHIKREWDKAKKETN